MQPVDDGIEEGVGFVEPRHVTAVVEDHRLGVPELLTKPTREGAHDEVAALVALLARLDLRPVDEQIATLATSLGATHGLRAADAVHLATAVAYGADRFITNNSADFPTTISEIDVTYPDQLPEPG